MRNARKRTVETLFTEGGLYLRFRRPLRKVRRPWLSPCTRHCWPPINPNDPPAAVLALLLGWILGPEQQSVRKPFFQQK